MKLNQYQRDAIVRAIFQDVPIDNDALKKAAQEALVKAMSPTVRKAYKVAPNALRTEYVDILHREGCHLVCGDADENEVLAPFTEAKDKYEEARRQLKGVIYSCSTLKRLNEVLPEFAAYFPKEGQATPNPPAVTNIVADLVKLGWKGAAK